MSPTTHEPPCAHVGASVVVLIAIVVVLVVAGAAVVVVADADEVGLAALAVVAGVLGVSRNVRTGRRRFAIEILEVDIEVTGRALKRKTIGKLPLSEPEAKLDQYLAPAMSFNAAFWLVDTPSNSAG